ncbi:MAG TPA: adenylate/guanylate cyclase domain-containing protein [Treponemataceae bacterium]|nr:adenylate/guanylate cyclase domain-containing protein [Treponemataceae bacterium]
MSVQIQAIAALILLAAMAILSGALVSARRRYRRDTARLSERIATTSEKASRQIQTFARIGTVISSSFDRDALLSQIILVLSDYWPGCAVRLLLYRGDGSIERLGDILVAPNARPTVKPSDENLMRLIATPSGGKRDPEWDLFLDDAALMDYAYNFPFIEEERFVGTLVLSSPIPLEPRDKLFMGDVAALVASAHRNVVTSKDRDRINDRFGKSVDPKVRDFLLGSGETGRILEVSVLFLDIRNFTALSERLGPTETVSFLNGVFTACETVVREEGGFINKFTGDGFMAVFGAPKDSATHREDAVRAATRIAGDLSHVPLGMGIASGPALAGTIGSQERLEYTVIGDTVNTASRIEGLCKLFGATIVVSGETLSGCGNVTYGERFLGTLRLKGKAGAIDVHEIFTETDRFPDSYLVRFNDAVAAHFNGEFRNAESAFACLAAERTDDPAAAWYLSRARERAASAVTAPWDGVEQLISK